MCVCPRREEDVALKSHHKSYTHQRPQHISPQDADPKKLQLQVTEFVGKKKVRVRMRACLYGCLLVGLNCILAQLTRPPSFPTYFHPNPSASAAISNTISLFPLIEPTVPVIDRAQAQAFVEELWTLLVDAQSNPR